MNLYTAHQKIKSHKCAAVLDNVFTCCLNCSESAVSCHRVLGRLFQTRGPANEKRFVVETVCAMIV